MGVGQAPTRANRARDEPKVVPATHNWRRVIGRDAERRPALSDEVPWPCEEPDDADAFKDELLDGEPVSRTRELTPDRVDLILENAG
jgi:hypothetical protein